MNGHDTGSRVPQHIVGVDTAEEVVTPTATSLEDTGFVFPSSGVPDAPMDDVVTPPMGFVDMDERPLLPLLERMPELTPGEEASRRRHIRAERGKSAIRERVKLPEVTEAWRESAQLRFLLTTAKHLAQAWLGMPTHVLGELSAQPGLHNAIMNAQYHIGDANRMLAERAGKTNEWLETFKRIAALSLELEVWEYSEMASAALMDGPYTEAWDGAIEWFSAAWSPPARQFDVAAGKECAACGGAHASPLSSAQVQQLIESVPEGPDRRHLMAVLDDLRAGVARRMARG